MGRILIDSKTGALISELESGDRIIRKSSVEANLRLKEYAGIPINEPFTKMYLSALMDLVEYPLTLTEQRIIWLCMGSVAYNTNVVANKNRIPITKMQIAKRLDCSRRNVERALKTLCDRGIISIYEVGDREGYILNPYIAMRGRGIDATLQGIFDKDHYEKTYDEQGDYDDGKRND